MIEVLGIVGSIASIIALIFSVPSIPQRFMHAIYGILFLVISCAAISYKMELGHINNAEKAAKALVANRRINFTDEGFNMAAMSFLEKHKNLYPDSYKRASELCENNGCLKNQHAEGTNALDHAYSQINVSSALEGMLKGIAEINSN